MSWELGGGLLSVSYRSAHFGAKLNPRKVQTRCKQAIKKQDGNGKLKPETGANRCRQNNYEITEVRIRKRQQLKPTRVFKTRRK